MRFLRLEGLSRTFGTLSALHGVNLDLQQGELLSLLGPSGCGKTTLLRIVAGFEHPDSGRVIMDGRDITLLPANRRGMGMVFQSYSLFPNLTAEQNVRFALRLRRIAKLEEQCELDSLFALIGLESARWRYPHQLSGGQQQRVALARALAMRPRLLLMDEPLSALDAQVRLQLRGEIRRIQRELGTTALYVTHDQEEALAISDRIAVMNQGRIVQVGSPEAIYRTPHSPFVAEFVGQVSLLRGRTLAGWEGAIKTQGGRRLQAVGAIGLSEDTAVRLYIRPEYPTLEANGLSHNWLEGKVLEKTFLWATLRLRLELVGDGELSVDVRAGELAAFEQGSWLKVFLPPEALQVIPESSAPAPLPVA